MVNAPQFQRSGHGEMITKKSVRQSSVSARWSIRCAIFALALMAVAVFLHRFEQIATGPFLSVLALAALIAALGLVLSVTGLTGLWLHGHAGGRRAAAALALCLIALTPFGYALYKAAALPRLADITTDLADPPQFAGSAAQGIKAELQAAAYPDVTGRRYGIAGENLLALVERQVTESGWRVIERRGNFGGAGEMLLEAEATTLIIGFKDQIVIRVTDEGETAYVDMRSKSGFGDYDMGVNAARIVKFMQALDALAAGAQTAK
jgi:ABC-type amino acid transport substrate-binding protein